MKVAIDITSIKDQYSGRGIGRYTQNLVSRIIKNRDHEWHLIGFGSENENLKLLESKKGPAVIFHTLGKVQPSNYKNPILFRTKFLPIIKKINPDVFFAPHFERGLPIGKTKVAVTVHDIIPMLTGSFSQKSNFFNFLKKRFYMKNLNRSKEADLIVTISDFSKNEFTTKGGFEKDKITVIPLGISDNFKEYESGEDDKEVKRTLMTYRITKPYFLYYGGLEKNKNVETLVKSFASITQRHPDLKLVIAGGEFKLGWDNKAKPLNKPAEEILKLVNDLKIQHKVIFTGRIDDKHLPTVLKYANAFIHLSEYEGFGLAVAEALAVGVPVIAANRSSYPEVLQDAALLVHPKSESKIAEAMNDIILKEELRKTLKQKGLKRAKELNWDTTAEETIKAFEKLHKENKLKVGIVTPVFYPQKGGAENNALSLAKRLVKDNYSVEVFTAKLSKDVPKFEEYKGIKIRRFPRLIPGYYISFYPTLLGSLLKAKLNYIHSHGFGFIWQDISLILKKLSDRKVKFVNTPHGPFMALKDYGTAKNIIRTVYNFVLRLYLNKIYSFVLQANPNQVEWLTKKYSINPKKIKLVPNGIEKDMFKKVETKSAETKYKIKDETVISYVGRLQKYKGVDQILNVLPSVLKKHKNLKFFIMGKDLGEKENYQNIIKENNLEKVVTIIDEPTDELRDKILQRSDIFVLPSEWEAFGIVILEAMAKGNAILTTKTEGGKYLIEEERNGYLFEYGNLEELKEKLGKLLKSKIRIAKIKKNNFKKAQEFVWDEIYEKYYRPLLPHT